eukprot:365947-Chlamydomonas_euryale.AAC.3
MVLCPCGSPTGWPVGGAGGRWRCGLLVDPAAFLLGGAYPARRECRGGPRDGSGSGGGVCRAGAVSVRHRVRGARSTPTLAGPTKAVPGFQWAGSGRTGGEMTRVARRASLPRACAAIDQTFAPPAWCAQQSRPGAGRRWRRRESGMLTMVSAVRSLQQPRKETTTWRVGVRAQDHTCVTLAFAQHLMQLPARGTESTRSVRGTAYRGAVRETPATLRSRAAGKEGRSPPPACERIRLQAPRLA